MINYYCSLISVGKSFEGRFLFSIRIKRFSLFMLPNDAFNPIYIISDSCVNGWRLRKTTEFSKRCYTDDIMHTMRL